MEVILTPEFKDLFPGEAAKVEELLDDVPSILTIQLMALINAELYSNDKGQETQVKLMNLMMTLQNPETRMKIIAEALKKMSQHKPGESTYFFTASYCMNFMHYELVNFRDLPDDDLSPQQELNVFKAYFLIAEQYANNKKQDIPDISFDDPHYFGKMMWPSLLDQFELSQPVNPYLTMLRGIVFLNYLQFHSPYSDYVLRYLGHHGRPTMQYILDIFQILLTNYRSLAEGGTGTSSFVVRKSEGFHTIFAQFTLDLKDYQQTYAGDKSNYSGIKAKPLLKLNDDTWIVLNWTFLGNKMYEGLLFDFYERSGISEHPHFKKFTDLKRVTGSQITETFLVRKLLKATFKVKHQILLFDEDRIPGFPDAYYRKGHKVFLFEIKDAYFPAAVINSFSYEKIMEVIDQKMNNKSKGTGQLIKQLLSLSQVPFENSQGYKHARNLEIYPVIIYGDIFFNMPGVNQYLKESFCKQIVENNARQLFKKVHPLTFINISFFLQYFDLMQTPETQLDALITDYHQHLARVRKRFNRTHEMIDHFEMHAPFEHIARKSLREDFGIRDYVKASLDALDITEGLPKG
ncbi:MAG: hypothetical protein JWP94_1819 [Mucilaginibacter sp.]|nr:hypothetical protein [Mucilaginibacter sp.]